MSFLERMDVNHNGMLEPSESQGRARMFLERIAQGSKLDLSKPIKLDKIAKAFEKMRESARSGSDDRSRGSSRGDDRGRGSSSGTAEIEPLVPGFGEPQLFDPVPAFGTLGEQYAVKIEDADRREAERTLSRYDANHDGILDKKEISRGRWTEDALKTDRNHDGKLSLNELALRYAMRRAARDGGSSSKSSRSSSSRSSGSSRSSRGSSGNSSDARMEMIVRMTMSRYDRNKNGILEKDEWKQFRTDPSAADTNHDGKISSSELGKWMASRMGGSRGGSDRGSSSGRSGWYAKRDGGDSRSRGGSAAASGALASSVGTWSRLHTATELLPEGLPDWFAQRDANADGQVMMHEFSTAWSSSVAADFTQFDLNGDGVITPNECLRATQAGAVLGSPGSAVLASTSSSSLGTSSSTGSSSGSSLASSAAPAGSSADHGSTVSTRSMSKAARKYVKYAVGYIKRYDTNHDGVLVKEEWSKMSRDYSGADADGDGRITPMELAEFMMKG